MNDLLSISEVSDRTGLASSALRYYERSGLIRAAGRVSGRRHYKESVLLKLAVISLLRDVGFTINEIAEILDPNKGSQRWGPLARAKLSELEEQMHRVRSAHELLEAALNCRCSSLDECDLVQSRKGRHRQTVEKVASWRQDLS